MKSKGLDDAKLEVLGELLEVLGGEDIIARLQAISAQKEKAEDEGEEKEIEESEA